MLNAPELIHVQVSASSPKFGSERTNNLSGNYRFSGIRSERPYYKVNAQNLIGLYDVTYTSLFTE